MKRVGDKLDRFSVIGVKPGFNCSEENGIWAFAEITERSFPNHWKVIYFYPKDFTFVCPTEIAAFSELNDQFKARDAILMGGNLDNEFVKLAWRQSNANLNQLNHYSFSDPKGSLIDQLDIRDYGSGVPLRATFLVDKMNIIQHCSAYNLNVGRNPNEILRVLDGNLTMKMCLCNRQIGGSTL